MLSRKLLLQTVSVDSLARLKASVLGRQHPEMRNRIFNVYFDEQQHFSLGQFLKRHLRKEDRSKECLVSEGGALMQVSSYREMNQSVMTVCTSYFTAADHHLWIAVE